jgi:7-cyano-7-deazaguanine synthase
MTNRALVLFSGGQDSTTCLAYALDKFEHVETLGFDYGQRHRIELDQRTILRSKMSNLNPKWAAKLGQDHTLDLGVLGQISDTALTRETQINFNENGLPNTFVPGRNLMFLTLAAALAYRRNITHIIGGMCETDFSGYPDCRDDTIKAMQITLNLGLNTRIVLHTPLMFIDKSQTWQLAETLGGTSLIDVIRADTHTCYLGERGTLHEWGYGCEDCPACKLRAAGWMAYKNKMPA